MRKQKSKKKQTARQPWTWMLLEPELWKTNLQFNDATEWTSFFTNTVRAIKSENKHVKMQHWQHHCNAINTHQTALQPRMRVTETLPHGVGNTSISVCTTTAISEARRNGTKTFWFTQRGQAKSQRHMYTQVETQKNIEHIDKQASVNATHTHTHVPEQSSAGAMQQTKWQLTT